MSPKYAWTDDENNDEEDVESKIGLKNFLKINYLELLNFLNNKKLIIEISDLL